MKGCILPTTTTSTASSFVSCLDIDMQHQQGRVRSFVRSYSLNASCKKAHWLLSMSATSWRCVSGIPPNPLAPMAHCFPSLVVTTAAWGAFLDALVLPPARLPCAWTVSICTGIGTATPANGMGVCSGTPLYVDICASAGAAFVVCAPAAAFARFFARENNWTGGDGIEVRGSSSRPASGDSESERCWNFAGRANFGGGGGPAGAAFSPPVFFFARPFRPAAAGLFFPPVASSLFSAAVAAAFVVAAPDSSSSGIIFSAFGNRTSRVFRFVFKLATAFLVAWLISWIFSSTASWGGFRE